MTELLRELDYRTDEGIDVWLLWRECDDRVVVAVVNENTGERFRVEVRKGERALEVFQHPYAYAGLHGVDTRSESRGVRPWAA